MNAHSFRAWLVQFEDEKTALGDLARDVAADSDFPRTGGSRAMRAYLEDVGANDRVFDVLDRAWVQFKRRSQ